MDITPAFSLRRLEMAMPLMELAQNKDPKAFVQLAALAMADNETLKLKGKGNEDAFEVFVSKAYDMDHEEVATILHFFTRASQRFTLVVGGLSPEEVNQVMAMRDKDLRITSGLESDDVLPK